MPRKLRILAALVFLAAAVAWAGEEQVRVEWKDEKLSVLADGVPLERILEEVVEVTGMWMDLRGSFPEPVRVGFSGLPLRQGVAEILSGARVSYGIMDYHDPETGAMTIAVSVGRPGAAGAGAPPDEASGAGLETVPRRLRRGARTPSAASPEPPAGETAPSPPPTSTPSGDPPDSVPAPVRGGS